MTPDTLQLTGDLLFLLFSFFVIYVRFGIGATFHINQQSQGLQKASLKKISFRPSFQRLDVVEMFRKNIFNCIIIEIINPADVFVHQSWLPLHLSNKIIQTEWIKFIFLYFCISYLLK